MGICPKVGRQDELGPVQEVVVLEIRNKADVEAEEERWRQTLAQTVKGFYTAILRDWSLSHRSQGTSRAPLAG